MRRRTCLLVLTALLVSASTLAAQARPRLGLGLGLQNTVLFADELELSALVPQLYVPIRLSDQLMIEPGLGLFRYHEEEGEFSSTGTILRLGAGLLFAVSSSSDGDVYIGPRVGILRLSSSVEAPGFEEDDDRTDLFLAGVAGGEFFLTPRFSLGGEAGLSYTAFGEVDDEDDRDRSLLAILTEFRVRWYFR